MVFPGWHYLPGLNQSMYLVNLESIVSYSS